MQQNQNRPIRWALCGAGDICEKRVAPALRDLSEAIPHSVSRNNVALLQDFAGRYGFEKTFKDWKDQFKDPEAEAVYIATPVNLHYRQALFAMEQGKHVLCEKPMALNRRDGQKMIDAAKANNVRFGIAYYRRFYPIVKRIRELLKNREIGEPVYVQIQNFEPFNREKGEPRYWLLEPEISGGGPMMDMGCHRIELLSYLFGDVTKVVSTTETLRFNRKVEDTSVALLKFGNNCLANIASHHSVEEPRDTLEIYGTAGSIHVENLNKGIYSINKAGKIVDDICHPLENAHAPLIANFCKSVREETEPAITGESALKTTEILDSVYGR